LPIKKHYFSKLLQLCVFFQVYAFDDDGPSISEADERVRNLTLLTKNVLEHYQNPDPVGLPDAIKPPYSDPEPIPDTQGALWSMNNSTMKGHSKFRLKKLYVNLVDLQACYLGIFHHLIF